MEAAIAIDFIVILIAIWIGENLKNGYLVVFNFVVPNTIVFIITVTLCIALWRMWRVFKKHNN
jgi:hypothetical protein